MQLQHKLTAIAAAEQAAAEMGFVLVLAICLSWRKRNKLGESRRIKLYESFYAVAMHDLTDLERNKYFKYRNNLNEVYK